MKRRHQRVFEAFIRARSFLDEHPSLNDAAFANARAMLDEAMRQFEECAGEQLLGFAQRRAAVQRVRDQMERLVDHYIRPIATIARAHVEPGDDAGLPVALRMPRLPLAPTRLIAVCDGMIATARKYEAILAAEGIPAGFLDEFAAACETLVRLREERARSGDKHIKARGGMRAALVRGRLAMDRLDALVRARMRGDEAMLAVWRGGKRVYRVGVRSVPKVMEDGIGVAA